MTLGAMAGADAFPVLANDSARLKRVSHYKCRALQQRLAAISGEIEAAALEVGQSARSLRGCMQGARSIERRAAAELPGCMWREGVRSRSRTGSGRQHSACAVDQPLPGSGIARQGPCKAKGGSCRDPRRPPPCAPAGTLLSRLEAPPAAPSHRGAHRGRPALARALQAQQDDRRGAEGVRPPAQAAHRAQGAPSMEPREAYACCPCGTSMRTTHTKLGCMKGACMDLTRACTVRACMQTRSGRTPS